MNYNTLRFYLDRLNEHIACINATVFSIEKEMTKDYLNSKNSQQNYLTFDKYINVNYKGLNMSNKELYKGIKLQDIKGKDTIPLLVWSLNIKGSRFSSEEIDKATEFCSRFLDLLNRPSLDGLLFITKLDLNKKTITLSLSNNNLPRLVIDGKYLNTRILQTYIMDGLEILSYKY